MKKLNPYPSQIDPEEAQRILGQNYGIQGKASPLPGYIDLNFRIETTDGKRYVLKISRSGEDLDYLGFQVGILDHLARKSKRLSAAGADGNGTAVEGGGEIESGDTGDKVVLERVQNAVIAPTAIPDKNGNPIPSFIDATGETRYLRLLTWISGRLWKDVNPKSENLRRNLGETCGRLTMALQGYDHKLAHRKLDWDITLSLWTKKYLHLFSTEEAHLISFFQDVFENRQASYGNLRKGLVHNDANDNNILVTDDFRDPKVKAIIDFGDAVHTQLINDLAITCTYAIMGFENPLAAALPIIAGYHTEYELHEVELEHLYTAIGMRLVLSVTQSALSKQRDPDNSYLLVSEKPAWGLLRKWRSIDSDFAHYSFREACGFTPHPKETEFKDWAKKHRFELTELFPVAQDGGVHPLDLSVESRWLGPRFEFEDMELFQFKLDRLQSQHPKKILSGGYLEPRALYSTADYQRKGNEGPENRTVHLGVDFWLPAGTAVHALLDGTIVTAVNDAGDKEYGGLIILKHEEDGLEFFTLYGHLSLVSISDKTAGHIIKKGENIGYLGTVAENGNWAPHLHFEIMLSMLGYSTDFPGVAYPKEVSVWKSICPDPNLLFKSEFLEPKDELTEAELLAYRKKYLGKSLSLHYRSPIKMVRGEGQYLIDAKGRTYLDTVNNVAHVGHEHPAVVRAGREQMALLNTNSRYLHESINALTEILLETFPPELSVVHFVNSGSEANELALRMAKVATGECDIIASEIGYHGNSNATVDISSYKFDGKGGQGAPENTHIFPLPDAFRGKYRGADTGARYAQEVGQLIGKIEAKGRGVAALIVEPIISCGGQIELPEGFLSLAYSQVRKAGGLCISDEVQVGCGRVGSAFWGFQLHGVIPDIVTIGKPLGNGHPVAAVVCTREVADKFANGMEYFNTFGGNPVSCAIGKAVLQTVKTEKLQRHAYKIGKFLKSGLQALASEHPIIGDVRGTGLFLGCELVDSKM